MLNATYHLIPAPTNWTTASALDHALMLHQDGTIDDETLIGALPTIQSDPASIPASWPELLSAARCA